MQYVITEELANRVLNYLALRPYTEVSSIISELTTMRKFEETAKEANAVVTQDTPEEK